MSRKSQNQWDFGELFPTEETRKVLSVSDLTLQIKRLLEKQIGQVWVSGEVTNLRAQSSGHTYFTLKDAGAQISCVLFRGEAKEQRALLTDGRKVNLQGEITVYEPRGQYQLRVTQVEVQGIGALQAAFERLKQKLNAEGLFAPERKRPLPRFAERIGIVTSPTGAAIRDVLHVIERRHSALEIILVPSRVQGDGAASEIAAGIRALNQWAGQGNALDLILVTRGGGSLEDLWAFNEEVVARAIFESQVPVVSAVGHEIDFTISDFVADFRAATPSAAAEIITEGANSARPYVMEAKDRLRDALLDHLERANEQVYLLVRRLKRTHPRQRLNERWQRLDDLQSSLFRVARYTNRERRAALNGVAVRWTRLQPRTVLQRRRERLTQLTQRLQVLARQRRLDAQQRLRDLVTRLRLLSPDQVLARGYSITTDATTGKVLRQADQVASGQQLKTRLAQGEITSTVDKKP